MNDSRVPFSLPYCSTLCAATGDCRYLQSNSVEVRTTEKLKQETDNQDWTVYEVAGVEPAAGPLGPVIILVGKQSDGLSYSLSQSSKKLVRKKFPHVKLVPNVFISTSSQSDLENSHGSIWDQIAIILTGLSNEKIEQLGGYEVYDPVTKTILRSASLAA